MLKKALCVVLILINGACAASAAVQYAVTDLGTMGMYSSYAHNMSESGLVVGRAEDGSNRIHFRTNGVTSTTIPVADSMYQDVVDVRSDGTVLLRRTEDGVSRTYLWQSPDAQVDIGSDTYPRDINDRGQVVGSLDLQSFLYDPINGMRSIPGAGDGYSAAFRLSSNGLVLGHYETVGNQLSGYIYDSDNNAFRDIGSLGGYTTANNVRRSAMPKGVNRFGQVVADGWDSVTDYQHATYWDDEHGNVDMGTLGGDYSLAYGINDSGVAVGISSLAEGYATHGYLWTIGGGMEDLNTLLEPGSTWTIFDARGINNNCQIVGTAYGEDGAAHAVLLTPVPEPATWIFMVTVFAFIFLMVFRPTKILRSYIPLVRWREKK